MKLVGRQEINAEKWDRCVASSVNPLIYANSWYLDLVCPNWKGIIYRDYEAVFPVPVSRKFGILQILQPPFAQQLGVFGRELNDIETSDFLDILPGEYRRVILRVNAVFSRKHSTRYGKRRNYILDLKEMVGNGAEYNENTRRNIKRASSAGIVMKEGMEVGDFIRFKRAVSDVSFRETGWKIMGELISEIQSRGLGKFTTAYSEDELIASVFFTKWQGRICYLFSASSNLGKERRAAFLIVNELISKHISKPYILDFEGSMNDNVARFFRGFGAVEEVYFEYKKRLFNVY